MSEFPGALADRFEPVRLLGQGGFGSVWLVRQRALERLVAIKTLNTDLVGSDEQVRRFEDEARLTARLRHPGVVTLLDHGVAAGTPWMAFEYVEGQSLREWVQAGPTPWPVVAEMARQVAYALEEARRHGVVHRDIKPDNILQGAEGTFKVADFGIAKWAGNSTRTAAGVVLGTPVYVSPMQIKGHLPAHRSDLYALGVTMYELLTGQPPFMADNPIAVLESHISAVPRRPREHGIDLPDSVERLVMTLLEKERDARFDTAQEVGDALTEILERARLPKPATPVAGTASGRSRRPPGSSGVTRSVSRTGSSVAPQPPARPPELLERVPGRRGLVAGLLIGLVALLAALKPATPPVPESPASSPAPAPSGAATPGAGVPDDPDLVTIERELVSLQRSATAMQQSQPQDGEAWTASSDQLARLRTVDELLVRLGLLVRRCLSYAGPQPERLLPVIELTIVLTHVTEVVFRQVHVHLLERGQPLDRTPAFTALSKLLALVAEPRTLDPVRLTVVRLTRICVAPLLVMPYQQGARSAESVRAKAESCAVLAGLKPPPGPRADALTIAAVVLNVRYSEELAFQPGPRSVIDAELLSVRRRVLALAPGVFASGEVVNRELAHQALFAASAALAADPAASAGDRAVGLELVDRLVAQRGERWLAANPLDGDVLSGASRLVQLHNDIEKSPAPRLRRFLERIEARGGHSKALNMHLKVPPPK